MKPGHLLGMTAVISVMPDGSCACLQTDLIDLAALGRLHVERATEVEFDNQAQLWVVKDINGTELYRHKFRDVCLNWERDYIVKREDAKHGGVT